ncbi:hypothetical protein NMY22_g352 [Coprinellus aureogranulatus]|nr:hypothetical protein NMY22_g352 [Coprinellus aureogranulatus]
MPSLLSKNLFRTTKSSTPKQERSMVGEAPANATATAPLSDVQPGVTLIVIGCGQRGRRRGRHSPEPTMFDHALVFTTWEDMVEASANALNTVGKRLADAVLVAVQDQMHLQVAAAFAKQGYHILCEKPMATTAEECIAMEEVVKEAGVIFGMGHVMRYSPYTEEISDIIASGALGELVNAVHVEPVGYYHFAHSYVRGNWRNERGSSFALLTKCCQYVDLMPSLIVLEKLSFAFSDIDLLCHWFGPANPTRVSSFGSLKHFHHRSKPVEAKGATRCLDCPMEKGCEYSAKKIYLDPVSQGHKGWPVQPLVDGVPDIENVTHALATGPYGRCVYDCDNDVCDQQVVNLEFSNGSTASMTMVAFSSTICERQTRLHFTHGEIVGDMNTFTVTDFRKRTTKKHTPTNLGGHGGGDFGLIRAFVEAVRTGNQQVLGTTVEEVLRSHLAVFAAEASRREGKVVDCIAFEREARTLAAVVADST